MANNADQSNEPTNPGAEGAGDQPKKPGRSRRRRRRGGANSQAAKNTANTAQQGGADQDAPDGNRRAQQGQSQQRQQRQPQQQSQRQPQQQQSQRQDQPQQTEQQSERQPQQQNRQQRGRRPPLPNVGRRPRRDEEIEPRYEPTRSPHAPAARQPGRPETQESSQRSRRGSQSGGRDQRPPQQDRSQEQSRRQGGNQTAGPRGKLRVIPLGGVGEVGKNMTLVEYERDLIMLDAGAKFPEEEQRGIDLIIPDVTYVRERLGNLRAILITHGHEDHIGGLPYILPQFADRAPIPIYGSPMALGFIETKLNEARMDKLVDLRPVQPGARIELGQLTAEFIHVTHSIPDTNAIAVHSPVGTIVDTADFKFDPTPVMGGPTDERLLRRLGEDGVLALFSDTVRVENEGSTPSERVVLETMDEVVRDARGQVIVTTFASNISRIHMAMIAAEKHGRKVAVAGRSMEQNARVALDLGYLDADNDVLLPLDEVLKLPKNKRLLVITGSQGEAAAALARIAASEHPKIRVGAGDVVLVSATPVPGNEETVTRTIDNLFRRGTSVIYSALNRGVHVSGHAGRDELRKMLKLLKPRYAVPIHGEYRHMVLYRELCGEMGIPPERVLLPEIGGVLEFTENSGRHAGKVAAGTILVDRLGDRGSGQVTLRDRDNLADDGVVVVTMVVDREHGKLIAGPDLVAKGLKPELQNGALREAEGELRRMLERRRQGGPQVGYLIQRSKEVVGKSLYRRSKSRPLILPVVTEL